MTLTTVFTCLKLSQKKTRRAITELARASTGTRYRADHRTAGQTSSASLLLLQRNEAQRNNSSKGPSWSSEPAHDAAKSPTMARAEQLAVSRDSPADVPVTGPRPGPQSLRVRPLPQCRARSSRRAGTGLQLQLRACRVGVGAPDRAREGRDGGSAAQQPASDSEGP